MFELMAVENTECEGRGQLVLSWGLVGPGFL